MPSDTMPPLRAPARQSVRLMARIPQDLTTQVQAYATTHRVTVSQFGRAGLASIITQPPTSVRPPPAPTR
jgi:hypothetical protein